MGRNSEKWLAQYFWNSND